MKKRDKVLGCVILGLLSAFAVAQTPLPSTPYKWRPGVELDERVVVSEREGDIVIWYIEYHDNDYGNGKLNAYNWSTGEHHMVARVPWTVDGSWPSLIEECAERLPHVSYPERDSRTSTLVPSWMVVPTDRGWYFSYEDQYCAHDWRHASCWGGDFNHLRIDADFEVYESVRGFGTEPDAEWCHSNGTVTTCTQTNHWVESQPDGTGCGIPIDIYLYVDGVEYEFPFKDDRPWFEGAASSIRLPSGDILTAWPSIGSVWMWVWSLESATVKGAGDAVRHDREMNR